MKYPTQFEIRGWIDEAFRGLSEPVTIEKIRRRLKRNLFPDKIAWHTMTVKSMPKNDVMVAGMYDQEEDKTFGQLMEVWLIRKTDPLKWTPKRHRQLRNILADCILHELQHRRQARARRFRFKAPVKLVTNREYLSNPDEVDAYAINVASEFYDFYKNLALAKIGQYPSIIATKWTRACPSPSLWGYLQEFGPREPTIKRLMKKAYKHLNKLVEDETRNNSSPHGNGKKLRQPKQGKTTQSRRNHSQG